MSIRAWHTARLRRLAHRIATDRREGVTAMTTPGFALLGGGFSHTLFDPINHKRRVEQPVHRISRRQFHERWARRFDTYGKHGAEQAAHSRLAIHNIRHGLPEPADPAIPEPQSRLGFVTDFHEG